MILPPATTQLLLLGAGLLLACAAGASPPAPARPPRFKLGQDFELKLKQRAESEDRRLSVEFLSYTIERSAEGSEDYAEVSLGLRLGDRSEQIKVGYCLRCPARDWQSYRIRVKHVDNRPPGATVLNIAAR